MLSIKVHSDTPCRLQYNEFPIHILSMSDPSGFDQVVVVERASRSILISWDPPAAPNGILTNYTVFRDGQETASLAPSVTQLNISSLLPFTAYTFSVVVCNSVGCVESPSVSTMTLEDSKWMEDSAVSC